MLAEVGPRHQTKSTVFKKGLKGAVVVVSDVYSQMALSASERPCVSWIKSQVTHGGALGLSEGA